MTSRYVPYATTPARLLGQLISDFVVGVWIAVWVVVGMAVHSAVAAIGDFGADIDSGASGIAGNLDEAGENASKVPLIGDALSSPLSAAGGFARDIAGAGHQLNTTATWLAWLLALAVAAPPILAIAGPWLVLRLRFFRRKWVALPGRRHHQRPRHTRTARRRRRPDLPVISARSPTLSARDRAEIANHGTDVRFGESFPRCSKSFCGNT